MDCPKFADCNAAFCPETGKGGHMPGDPVCVYLREAVKDGAEARLTPVLSGPLTERVLRHASELLAQAGPLSRVLRQAAKRGSRLECGKAMRGAA